MAIGCPAGYVYARDDAVRARAAPLHDLLMTSCTSGRTAVRPSNRLALANNLAGPPDGGSSYQ